jgi:hypothetical protein
LEGPALGEDIRDLGFERSLTGEACSLVETTSFRGLFLDVAVGCDELSAFEAVLAGEDGAFARAVRDDDFLGLRSTRFESGCSDGISEGFLTPVFAVLSLSFRGDV